MFGNRTNNRDRPVCQFYLEGRCRFGDNCKNEHPAGQGNQNSNRFAALDNQRGRSGGFGSNQPSQNQSQNKVEPDLIKADLTTERPIWPLSSYGPGKNPPRNLISVDLEQSPEEMRVLHYQAVASGNAQETPQREAALMQNMDDTVKKILSDLNGAAKYVMDGYDQHPNRIDLANGETSNQNQTSTSFGQASTQPSNNNNNTSIPTFGQLSSFGQASTFGQPSAFGKPSSLGQTSSFGQPSKPGTTSAFGQPSFGQATQPSVFAQPGRTPAFGQTGFGSGNTQQSTFGQPSAPQSTFGKPSAFGTASQPQSTFGQPSAFGAPSQPTSAFGQPSAFGAAAQPSTFGTTAQAAPQSAFGQPSAFGAAATKPSPFASTGQSSQPSTFGAPSAFGAAAQNSSPFGASAAAKTNPFSSNNTTQMNNANQNPFGSNSAQSQQTTTFGQPSQPAAFGQSSQPSAFGQPSQPPAFGQQSQPSNNGTTSGETPHIQTDGSGQPISFKGRPVSRTAQTPATYTSRNPQTGKDERIWFPTGTPKATADVLAPSACYQGEQGPQLEALYKYVLQHGVFENGIMPETPPMRAWVAFDI